MTQYSCFVQSFLRFSYGLWRFWTIKFYCNVNFANFDVFGKVAKTPAPHGAALFRNTTRGVSETSLYRLLCDYRELPYSLMPATIGNNEGEQLTMLIQLSSEGLFSYKGVIK